MTLPYKSSFPPKSAGLEPTFEHMDSIPSVDRPNRQGPGAPGNLPGLVWFAVGLFQVGLLAGIYFSHFGVNSRAGARGSVSPGPHGTPGARLNDQRDAVADRSLADFAQADEFLKRGWYEHALARYEASTKISSGELPGGLQFRVALCLEGLGQHDRAIAAYGEIADRFPNDPISRAARLAGTRLSVRLRDIEASKRALGNLLLKSAAEARTATPDAAELSSLLGLVLAMEASENEKTGPESEFALAFPALDWRPEALLEAAESWTSEPTERPVDRPAESFSVDVRPTGSANCDCDVSVTANQKTALEVIERLAYVANITCVWTDAARDCTSRTKIDAATAWLSWPAVIECLTGPLQIAWELRDEKLCLSLSDEISEEDRLTRLINAARLILSASVHGGGANADAAIAYLGLGNLEFFDGQAARAATWFERVTQETPRSAQVFPAQFNLGIVRRSMRDVEGARSAFLHAVDISPVHALAPLAYLFVGRMHLDDFDPERAVPPLRRSVSMATSSETRAAAAIDLATAMLLAKSWRAASTLLAEQHGVLDQPAYRDAAAFLETYSRYHLPGDRKPGQREAQALVSTLVGLKSDTALPSAGVLLVGRAYAELGLDEQMATTLEQALKRGVSKPIAHEISCQLAEFSHLSGKDDEAMKRLSAVFVSATPAKARHAGMRIAEITLADNRTEECLRICRKMLADADKTDTAAILRLMGKAFEQAGDHPRAAECFAGRLPAEARPPAAP